MVAVRQRRAAPRTALAAAAHPVEAPRGRDRASVAAARRRPSDPARALRSKRARGVPMDRRADLPTTRNRARPTPYRSRSGGARPGWLASDRGTRTPSPRASISPTGTLASKPRRQTTSAATIEPPAARLERQVRGRRARGPDPDAARRVVTSIESESRARRSLPRRALCMRPAGTIATVHRPLRTPGGPEVRKAFASAGSR